MSQASLALALALALPEYSSSPPPVYNVAPVATERVIAPTLSSRLWSKCNPQPDEGERALVELEDTEVKSKDKRGNNEVDMSSVAIIIIILIILNIILTLTISILISYYERLVILVDPPGWT